MKINEAVRNMSPPRYTRKQAAELVGRSADTLVRWRDTGVYRPSDSTWFGHIEVDLYTPKDIAALKKIAKTMKTGRKPSSI